MTPQHINRRTFVAVPSAALVVAAASRKTFAVPSNAPASHQATGLRIGEVTPDSAVIWTRLTAEHERNNSGLVIPGRAVGKRPEQLAKVTVPVEELEGACPAADGRIRLRYGVRADVRNAVTTGWVDVAAAKDSVHKFLLENLRPDSEYDVVCETTGPGGEPRHGELRAQFATAPRVDDARPLRFCVMTCQGYPDRGHPDGHPIYPAMQALAPRFACLTGDLVYYDNDEPRAITPALARYHWERMFSLPRLREFTRSVATYWLKDDHDTLDNDSWPGRSQGGLTFAEGQKIFRQQAPMLPGGPGYRTFRHGKDLQIWLIEGRDHRSANDEPDGEHKTILGADQKAWLTETLAASDATWKVLISPTPFVGPDRKNKSDSHANDAFAHEGDELRAWFAENVPDNFFVICGDRHWQYHSVHPVTGLHEFSVGPASNEHAAGSPGEDPRFHRFHRVKGGFLSVSVSRRGTIPHIRFELRDIAGNVVYHFEVVGKA
jgi:alkaline phosphatase D